LLLFISKEANLVILLIEKGIYLGKLADSLLNTLLSNLKATNSCSLFNSEFFYKKKLAILISFDQNMPILRYLFKNLGFFKKWSEFLVFSSYLLIL
jgi:hypothetical protein